MEKQNRFILYFSKEDLNNPKIKKTIKDLINLKLENQKYKDFVSISPAEFEILTKMTGEFVPKEKYNNMVTFKGEVGKIRGKKLVVIE